MSLLTSSIYSALVRTSAARKRKGGRRAWAKVWTIACSRWDEPVLARVHGQKLWMFFGNLYPITVRELPSYNAPLVEAVAQTYHELGRRVTLVDVGSSVGDSVFLLRERCPGMIAHVDCIEGHAGFYDLLRRNLGTSAECTLHHAMLSADGSPQRSLVRTHRGTASAQGGDQVPTMTLDDLLDGKLPDVIKVDTDGFDGTVLGGARAALASAAPTVVFEWHPILIRRTGNDEYDAFEVLGEAGYQDFVFYGKDGRFSHFMLGGVQRSQLQPYVRFCLERSYDSDWHYDVVALAAGSAVSAVSLADLAYASNFRSAVN